MGGGGKLPRCPLAADRTIQLYRQSCHAPVTVKLIRLHSACTSGGKCGLQGRRSNSGRMGSGEVGRWAGGWPREQWSRVPPPRAAPGRQGSAGSKCSTAPLPRAHADSLVCSMRRKFLLYSTSLSPSLTYSARPCGQPGGGGQEE